MFLTDHLFLFFVGYLQNYGINPCVVIIATYARMGVYGFRCSCLKMGAWGLSKQFGYVPIEDYLDEQCNLVSTVNVLFCYKKLDSVA